MSARPAYANMDSIYCTIQRRTEAWLSQLESNYLHADLRGLPRGIPDDSYLRFLMRMSCVRISLAAMHFHKGSVCSAASSLRRSVESAARAFSYFKDTEPGLTGIVDNLKGVIVKCVDGDPVKATMVRMVHNPVFHTLRFSWPVLLKPTRRQILLGFADAMELIERILLQMGRPWFGEMMRELRWHERNWYFEENERHPDLIGRMA
jgi:hypothetical protein